MNKLEVFLRFLKELIDRKYTGQLQLNFHEGNLSEKIEKKESMKLSANGNIILQGEGEVICSKCGSNNVKQVYDIEFICKECSNKWEILKGNEEAILPPPQAKGVKC